MKYFLTISSLIIMGGIVYFTISSQNTYDKIIGIAMAVLYFFTLIVSHQYMNTKKDGD